jgi:hypothetical protein
MKTFLHVGFGPKRKDITITCFASWNALRFYIYAANEVICLPMDPEISNVHVRGIVGLAAEGV